MAGDWKVLGMLRSFRTKEDILNKIEEKKLAELITSMVQDVNVTKLVSPNTDEYFLLDKSREVYVCLEVSQIRVANHGYALTIRTTLAFSERVKEIVKNKVEIERQQLKKELFKNQLDLIDKIKNNYATVN